MDLEKTTEEQQADVSPDIQLILFTLNGVEYALNIAHVMEIIKLVPLTILPEAPKFIKGVLNLRSKVIPIIDLRERFGIEHKEHTKKTRVIIAKLQNSEIGIIVDSVTEVINIKADTIEPPLPVLDGVRLEFIEGIAKFLKRLIMIINIDRILSSGEKGVLKGKKDEW